MMYDYLNLALKNIAKRKLRTFLTLVGILISIATIFVLISLSLGLNVTVQEQFQKLGGDKFFVQPRGQFGPPGAAAGATLTKDDVDVIKKVPGVKEVTYYTVGNAKIEYRKKIRFVSVVGANLDDPDLFFSSFNLDDGRLLEKSDARKIVVGSQYKQNNYLGSPLSLRNTITVQGNEFKITGILKTQGTPQDDRLIFMPEDEFRTLFNITDRIDFIIVQVQDGADINEVADASKKKLMNYRDVNEKTLDFTILTPEELLATFSTVLNIITSFLFGIAAISLVVGGINIANTMFTSVLERTKEIGVMKAIGARNSDILLIFLIEAGLLGLVGGIAGILLGFTLAKSVEYIAINLLATTLLKASTPSYLFIGCLAFSFLAGAISGFWPAWRATQIKPVDALRYE